MNERAILRLVKIVKDAAHAEGKWMAYAATSIGAGTQLHFQCVCRRHEGKDCQSTV